MVYNKDLVVSRFNATNCLNWMTYLRFTLMDLKEKTTSTSSRPLSHTPNTPSLFHLIFFYTADKKQTFSMVLSIKSRNRRSAFARLINNGEGREHYFLCCLISIDGVRSIWFAFIALFSNANQVRSTWEKKGLAEPVSVTRHHKCWHLKRHLDPAAFHLPPINLHI